MGYGCPLPDYGLPFDAQADLIVLAQMVLGEARGEPYEGQLAVAHVAMNRVADPRWPDTPSAVVLQPKQFSCFNDGSPCLPLMRQPARHASSSTWDSVFRAACAAYFGLEPDPTGGANHYLNEKVTRKIRGGSLPRWFDERKVTRRIGGHTFLRG